VVSRVVVQDVPQTEAIPFASTEQGDPKRYVGQRKVLTAGTDGQRTVVNRITTVDGVESARELVSDTVTVEPVGRVVAVGTSPRPAAAASSAPAGVSADGLNWAALAACESGGRADAVSASGSYYGLYQFSVGTWKAVGGTGLPSQASADEQTARAQALYARSGAGQWPHCGSHLFG